MRSQRLRDVDTIMHLLLASFTRSNVHARRRRFTPAIRRTYSSPWHRRWIHHRCARRNTGCNCGFQRVYAIASVTNRIHGLHIIIRLPIPRFRAHLILDIAVVVRVLNSGNQILMPVDTRNVRQILIPEWCNPDVRFTLNERSNQLTDHDVDSSEDCELDHDRYPAWRSSRSGCCDGQVSYPPDVSQEGCRLLQ
ncbi:hypothetical protein D3C86_1465380 [compost metagenome]